MSIQAQIDADAALARRLQEEEFASQLPHMHWAPSPPSPPPPQRPRPPPTLARTDRQPPPPLARTDRQPPPPLARTDRQPSYPQPTREWPQPASAAPPAAAPREARFPFVPPRASFGAADVLTDLFRHIAESSDGRRTPATDGLSDLGDFPGSAYVPRDQFRRRAAPTAAAYPGAAGAPPPSMRTRRAASAGSSADGMLNSILQETFGRMDDGMFAAGGGFAVTPDGVQFEHVRTPGGARVTFTHERSTRPRGGAARAGAGSDAGRARMNQHQQHQQHGARVHFGEAGDMMNLLFSGTFGPLTGMGAGAAGGGTFGDWFRSMMPGGLDGGETYEDWLNVIERMGGNVNRGGTEAEIDQLPTHSFEAEAQSADDTDGEEKCAICLGEYEKGEQVKVLPCAHRFHAECVDQWLRVNRICPFCKQSIRDGDGARGRRQSSA